MLLPDRHQLVANNAKIYKELNTGGVNGDFSKLDLSTNMKSHWGGVRINPQRLYTSKSAKWSGQAAWGKREGWRPEHCAWKSDLCRHKASTGGLTRLPARLARGHPRLGAGLSPALSGTTWCLTLL